MGLLFGMDEAGYGPNLGPLVITVTAWEVPGSPMDFDCWDALKSIIARPDDQNKPPHYILVGDSKQIYTPARGLKTLESSVLTLLSSISPTRSTFQELYKTITGNDSSLGEHEPWYREDLVIPHTGNRDADLERQWKRECNNRGLVFRGTASQFVLTEHYNQLIDQYSNKGLALSRLSLALLRTLWNPSDDVSTLIIADKHGGRNRYDQLLTEVLEDQFIFRLEEGSARSRYRVGTSELCFQTKAEAHFPVAVSSMISKYLRELAMDCFNRFWQSHIPNLKPTKGYPVDAARFRKDIAAKQKELAIPDEKLWRSR